MVRGSFHNGHTHSVLKLRPNDNVWFKEGGDGSFEFIAIIGIQLDEPLPFDQMLARYSQFIFIYKLCTIRQYSYNNY